MTDLIIGGETFHVQVDGDAGLPALLLSNSLGTNVSLWDGQVPELSQHFRVIRYDSRGHGGTTPDGAPYSIARLGRDALAILDAVNVETASFIGISMGGAVGLWLLINAPERIERAVLANTAARLGSPASWNARILSVLKSGMGDNADATIERWFSPIFARKAPERVAAIHESLRTTSPDGYAASCAALRDMDLREALPRITRPVLVISGKDDPVIPDTETDALVAAIANARHVPLNARHISNIEAEEAFTKAVLRFLLAKRLRSAPTQANRRLAAKRSSARGPLQPKAPSKKVRKTASKAAMPSRRPVAGKKLAKARTTARQALKGASQGTKSPAPKSAPAKSGAVKKSPAKKATGKTTKRAPLKRATTSARSAVKKTGAKKSAKTTTKKIGAKKNIARKIPASRRTPRKAPRRPTGRRK